MERFLVKVLSQGSGKVEGRGEQGGVSSTNDAQAKPTLSSLVSSTLEEGHVVDTLLKTLLGWMDHF
jgi:hypothetical protein